MVLIKTYGIDIEMFGIWMYNLMNDGKITVFGDGSQKRAFTFMDDINEPLWESAVSPKQVNR